ncbi:hypothetical protein K505DRAFT_239928 [Melanomma pulvis-pyrius CBS 109.77]|uniref:Rhodopsin domain-containing protein n=1 Tax=Melanomma pulvis-pyrius CBS 109.77 TaxID=1314802 RepID=A0A6A6XG43_9PLEO|nr:hypothetical protein K505DRAFT_239928 [Melanomma pulvis-pyrius CBS 109.77]
MGCARISLCILIKQILPGNTAKYTAMVFAGFTALWTVSGVLVTAFPCSFPNPWQFLPGKKCFELVKFVNYVGITNIVVEVLLVMIPLFVWNLRLTAGRRVSYDFTFHYWRTVLCIQVAQNLSVITACLPYLHPFIISILAGRTQPDSLVFEHTAKCNFKEYFCTGSKFDSISSQSSSRPMKNATDLEYCRPLATWGLDRSSAHLHSQHFNRFPSHIAAPITGPAPPENVFNRSVHIESLRPGNSSKELPPIPKTLSQVGVLPLVDWDTDGSDRDSAGSSASRRPASDYVFNREKVISVPENHELYREDYWRKYPPPPMSPKYPREM